MVEVESIDLQKMRQCRFWSNHGWKQRVRHTEFQGITDVNIQMLRTEPEWQQTIKYLANHFMNYPEETDKKTALSVTYMGNKSAGCMDPSRRCVACVILLYSLMNFQIGM